MLGSSQKVERLVIRLAIEQEHERLARLRWSVRLAAQWIDAAEAVSERRTLRQAPDRSCGPHLCFAEGLNTPVLNPDPNQTNGRDLALDYSVSKPQALA
jgi:hypothetical protein